MRQDNCFPWIADSTKAQRLMDRQWKTNWPKMPRSVARQPNPVHRDLILLLSAYSKNVAADLTPKRVSQLAKVVKEEFGDE